ncbi:hypothetical protein IGI39_001455 [Enterococcus sp. AZ135]|uniref:AAA family ATPase n=1 Tax=unclassified Enterococcus TaxID=2608891 RepID=UPI003F233506
MMGKKLILIGGPMGSGKTTVSKILNNTVHHSAFLDGDWCWEINPFIVNEENKRMVFSNIHFLLNSFISNTTTNTIIFCWVMDEQEIIQRILTGLDLLNVEVTSFSLLPSPEKLTSNIEKDILLGIRNIEDINRSISRLPKYQGVASIHIDTTFLTATETADKILDMTTA